MRTLGVCFLHMTDLARLELRRDQSKRDHGSVDDEDLSSTRQPGMARVCPAIRAAPVSEV
jgi:hypothetical protein